MVWARDRKGPRQNRLGVSVHAAGSHRGPG